MLGKQQIAMLFAVSSGFALAGCVADKGATMTMSSGSGPTIEISGGAFSMPAAQPAGVAALPPGTPIPTEALAQALPTQTAYGKTREVGEAAVAQATQVASIAPTTSLSTDQAASLLSTNPPSSLAEALKHPALVHATKRGRSAVNASKPKVREAKKVEAPIKQAAAPVKAVPVAIPVPAATAPVPLPQKATPSARRF